MQKERIIHKTISAEQLDELLSRSHLEKESTIVLLSPAVLVSDNLTSWFRDNVGYCTIYQLIEVMDNLTDKLAPLKDLQHLVLMGLYIGDEGVTPLTGITNLTNLTLIDNQIGDAGAQALAQLSQLTKLNVSRNKIGDAGAQALAQLSQLTKLNVSQNEIGEAGAQALAQLSQLTKLNVSQNQIGEAGAQALAQLSQLTNLDVSQNQIGDAGAQALAQLSQLTNLNVSWNQIGDAGAQALAQLSQLTNLDVGYNQIGEAGAQALAQLSQLTNLNVSWNQIGDAGAQALAQLSQLTNLDVGYNQIGEAGAQALAQLSQLTDLDVGQNQIGEAGAQALAQLSQLTNLDVSGIQIGEAGAQALAQLSQLTNLNVGWNQIGEAGAQALAQLSQLTNLNVSGNQIGEAGVQALAQLSQLTNLNVSGNQIGEAGVQALARLSQLTNLDVSENQIGEAGAQALAQLSQLTNLDVSGNEIGDAGVQDLARLSKLSFLNLSKNPIAEVAPLTALSMLRALLLSETRVSDLTPLLDLIVQGMPVSLDEFKQIGIIVKDCPLVHPPTEVVNRGRDAILNYFDEIVSQGTDQLFEAKVMLVGEGGAGKTSLLRRLYQPGKDLPTEDETTRGIDIHRYDFISDNGRPFRLNVWDFGGQQIYHSTHQFFLTKRSLYLLVDDTRKDDKSVQDKGFKYWLEIIEVLGDKSPVLIFQNEKGGRSKTIDESGIKGRFSNVQGVYQGDLEKPDAADQLAKAIKFYAQSLPHIGEELPAKWVAIRKAIEEESKLKPFISQQRYFEIYSQYLEFDRSKALHLSGYLHDLGVFLHYQDDLRLKKTVMLQNHWATDAVFAILDDEPVKTRLGRFTLDDCERLWHSNSYADMHPELLALMEKFELCYPLAETQPQHWLVPELLYPSMPKELDDWNEPGDLVLSYVYEFLPKGLISRLMVRNNRFVFQPDMAWITGVLFERDTTQLLAQVTTQGNEILLRARGPENKDLLSVIASDLDTLNASFHGLVDKIEKNIPCICSGCRKSKSPYLFSQNRLLQRKKAKKFTVECDYSYQDVDVLELLDGLKLDRLPTWADNNKQPRGTGTELAIDDKAETIFKIFLASSSELRDDRDAFDLYFRQQNDKLRKQGLYLEIIRWENFLDAMSETRTQDEYNQAIRDCDIFVSLFATKTGKYTDEEFDAAHKSFKDTGKPSIYTFFKESIVSTDKSNRKDLLSLWDFQKKLEELGHFYTAYKNIEDLKLQFKDQLEKLGELNK